jgi:hypothetical protein
MGRSGHDLTAGDEVDLQVIARLFAAAEIAEPRGECVDAGRDKKVPEADAVGDEGRPPQVVALARHRGDSPLAGLAVPHVQAAVEFLVAVADDVGLDHHIVAADPLHREAASIHLRPHAIDHHPASELIGEFHGSFPARLPGLLLYVAKV